MSTIGIAGEFLRSQLEACSDQQFTGYLEIQDGEDCSWMIHFRLGRLVNAESSMHPFRRWYRQVQRYCNHLDIQELQKITGSDRCWTYNSILLLVEKQKISREQIDQVIRGNLVEILFDILQASALRELREQQAMQYTPKMQDSSALPLVLIKLDEVWKETYALWRQWQMAGLFDESPNHSPQVWRENKLQEQTPPQVYKNLMRLANQERSLHDLAVRLRKPTLAITKAFIPYIRQGLIKLVEIDDFSCCSVTASEESGRGKTVMLSPESNAQDLSGRTQRRTRQRKPQKPLIVYIDDSAFDSHAMEQVLAQLDYRYLNIADPVQALPIMLEQRPVLIFLDLVMPVANGYEVCAQIRRISQFKQLPVIIVTSSDGIVDRVRAKVVGASGFIAKPIDANRVQQTLKRHLSKLKESV